MSTTSRKKSQPVIDYEKKKKLKQKYLIQEISLYFATVVGVVISKYLPDMMKALVEEVPTVKFHFSWFMIVSAMCVAALVTFVLEKEGDVHGKMRNFKRRLLNHIAYGTFWYVIMEAIGEGL